MEDFQLTKHFGFYEFTKTNQEMFQTHNRVQGMNFLNYLKALAQMMEKIRGYLEEPILIHSAFRSDTLNENTKGSSKTSQHLMGQACDFTAQSYLGNQESFDVLFQHVLMGLKDMKIPFGQLIREKAVRDYGVSRWLHLSLGTPYREASKCG